MSLHLSIAFINILVAIPYYPTFLAGILVVILMVVILLMVIVYRGIDTRMFMNAINRMISAMESITRTGKNLCMNTNN